MKAILIFFSLFVISNPIFAEEDLNLGGAERWEARFSGYVCNAFQGASVAPYTHRNMHARFDWIRTDRSLDNGLIKGSFLENGVECSYSAILFADNAASTIRLVRSKAFSRQVASEDCSEGKAILDYHLKGNVYLYWGHPHHLSIMMPVQDAAQICGEKASHIGLDFTVSRKID